MVIVRGGGLSLNRVQHYVTPRPAKGPGPRGPSEHLRRLRHAYGTHPSPRSTRGNDTADPMRQAGHLLVPLPRRGSRWQTRTSCTYHNWEAVPECCRSCGNVVSRHCVANMCWASCSDDNCPADQEHLHNCVPTPPPPPPPPVSQRPQRARVPPPPPPPPAPRPSCGVRPWDPLTRQPHDVNFSPRPRASPACREQGPRTGQVGADLHASTFPPGLHAASAGSAAHTRSRANSRAPPTPARRVPPRVPKL